MCREKKKWSIGFSSERSEQCSASFRYVICLTHLRFLKIWPLCFFGGKNVTYFDFIKYFMDSKTVPVFNVC